jgi:hypothetical protein
MRLLKPLLAIYSLAILAGCSSKKAGEGSQLPNPSGAICDVLVVTSNESWKGKLGRTYKEVLEDQYPYLPQAEPSFKVMQVSKEVFPNTAVNYRNLIVNKLSPEYREPKLTIQKNVYASSQVVVTILAANSHEATIFVKQNGSRIRDIFDQTEKDRYAEVVKKQALVDITQAVKEKFGIDLYFPSGYAIRTNKPSFMWISLETTISSQGLLIYTTPYQGSRDISQEVLLKNSADFMERYVPGPSQGSYMVNVETVPPKYEKIVYKGREWFRMRGFWDVHKEFMGGPFISYSTILKEKNEVLTIRAYVYSPKKDKRKPLLQTEALIFNINLDGK